MATSQLPAEDIARPHQTIFREWPGTTAAAQNALMAGLTSDDLDGTTYVSAGVDGHEVVAGTQIRVSFQDGPGLLVGVGRRQG